MSRDVNLAHAEARLELNDKVVVIVGGGAGIGAAGAGALAAAGCAVVVADVDERAARACAEEIRADGGRADSVRCEATSEADLAAVHARALETFGRVDVLWCHAGRAVAGRLEQIPVDHWARLLDLNCLGPVRAFAEFGPSMVERGSGHIIVTSSSLALFPEQFPITAPYVLTKSALVGYARSLRAYLEPHGVGVTLLCPDATSTRHATHLEFVGLDPSDLGGATAASAMDTPEAVARALVDGLSADRFLISLTADHASRLRADLAMLVGDPDVGDPDAEFGVDADAASATIVVAGELAVASQQHGQLAAALREVTAATRVEQGNLAYRWTSDLERSGVFYLFEEWESAKALEGHAASEHGRAFLEVLAGLSDVTADLRIYDARGSQPMDLPD